MKLSVVIPTYNGKNKIVGLLKSLEQQSFKDFEVIVLIDGSTDGTEEFLKSQSFQLDLKIFFRENGGRAVARNAGASFSSGEVLIFFDDDIRVKEDTIEKHYQHHTKYSSSALTGTTTLDPKLCTTEISKYRHFIETERWRNSKIKQSFQMNNESLQITTQNFSIDKKVFDEIGGFDERLRDSEDFELGLRLLQNNIPIFLDEDLEIWHEDYVSFENYVKRQKEYVIARYELSKLYPELLEFHPQGFAMIASMHSQKSQLKSIFAYNKFWKSLISTTFFKKLIPQKIRYKIYDLLIYSHSRKKMLAHKKRPSF